MQTKSGPPWARAGLILLAAACVLALAMVMAANARALLFQTVPTMPPKYTLPPGPGPTDTPQPPPGPTDTQVPPPGPTNTTSPGTPPPPGQTPTKPIPTAQGTLAVPTTGAAPAASEIEIAKQVSRQDVLPGEVIQYTVWITNTGPDVATGLVLRDWLDPSLELLGLSASEGAADVQGQEVRLNIGMLEPGQSVLALLDARVSQQAAAGLIILNQATLYYDGGQVSSPVVAIGLPPDTLPATGAERRQP